MSMFRKRPVEVQAVRWDGTPEGATPIIQWLCGHDVASTWSEPYEAYTFPDGKGYPASPGGIKIQTLEGDMLASAGDWIIRGVKGEFYPCKPDIFEATYEAADVPGAGLGSSLRAHSADVLDATERPRIVCLCGSTRFGEAFQKANLTETLAGRIVLSIGCDMRSDVDLFAGFSEATVAKIKTDLDELHKRKIDLADEVLILNVGGYVGDSTRSEIDYAEAHGKPIRWLEMPELVSDRG